MLPLTSNVDRVIVSFGKFLQTSSNVEHFANTRLWTKKYSCPYWFQEIRHFQPHLQRHNQGQIAVTLFLSMSVNDPKLP